MAEYVTISEFAKMANISRQAVYKRIDKDLKGYIVRESNKLKINVDAIHMIDSNAKVEHTEISECPEVSTVVNLQNLVDKKEQQINDLLEIIKEQNKAIAMLITRQSKRSFWRKLISRNEGD